VPSGKLWSASSSDIASAGPDQVLSKGNNGRLRGSLGWINKGIEKRPVALPVSGSASMPFSTVFSSFPLLMESGSAGSKIGRASCREKVCQYVEIPGVRV